MNGQMEERPWPGMQDPFLVPHLQAPPRAQPSGWPFGFLWRLHFAGMVDYITGHWRLTQTPALSPHWRLESGLKVPTC